MLLLELLALLYMYPSPRWMPTIRKSIDADSRSKGLLSEPEAKLLIENYHAAPSPPSSSHNETDVTSS